MNPQQRDFYVSMGYSQQQVIRAYEYSIKQKVDILDALTFTSQKPQQSPPSSAKKENNFVGPQPKSQNIGKNSFLVSSSKIKLSDYEVIYSINNKQNILNSKYQLREAHSPVGLLNISNCCYLNSLLQCYFLMDDFKIALLSAEPIHNISQILADNKTKLKRVKNQFELLSKIKRFFTKMTLSSKKFLDPTQILQNLVDSVGQKISYGQQKDLSEINIMIIQRISQGLNFCRQYYEEQEINNDFKGVDINFFEPDKGKKYTSIYNPKTGTIKKLFYGTKVEYYDDKELKDEPPIVNDFTGIILNPRFGTLYQALEEQFNFSVEINNKIIKKQMFIRQEPQYLFMYINRTQFDRDIGQMQKNQQKFSFDFTFYLDRYLQKHRGQKNQKDIIINELIQRRNRIKEQINNLQLLYKKMEQCYKYALELEGWLDKLPSQEDFEEQYNNLKENLDEVERDLEKIESREQEYHLMYVFVHRGDAASGHYWGYGRNDLKWYKFDIKCREIQQQQILIDIQKASATPYALLYVKKAQIPNFSYNYYLQRANFQENLSKTLEHLDLNLAQQIIKENVIMHSEIKQRNFQIFKKKSYLDYLARYKAVKMMASKQQEMAKIKQPKFIKMYFQYCLNFSTFLNFKGQHQLCKFTLFQQSILLASGNKMDSQKLLRDKQLLQIIQKKFRKSCKGDFTLRNYAVLGKDLQKYRKLYQEYQFHLFQIVWTIFFTQQYDKLNDQLMKIDMKTNKFCLIDVKEQIRACLFNVLRLLNTRTFFKRHEDYKNAAKLIQNQLYLAKVNDEMSKLALLKLVVYGFKLENLNIVIDSSDIAVQQIAAINANNSIVVSKVNENPPVIQSSRNWISQYFRKSVNRSSLTNEKNLSQKKSQRKTSNSELSPLKVSLFKTNSNHKIEEQEKKVQDAIISKNQNLLILDMRQNWKIEDLENAKKFNISERIKNYLQKMGNILQFYKCILSQNRLLSSEQIFHKGIILNQEKNEQQQSLI